MFLDLKLTKFQCGTYSIWAILGSPVGQSNVPGKQSDT